MRVYNFPKNYGDNLPQMTKSEWEAQALEDGWIKVMPSSTTFEEFVNAGSDHGTAVMLQPGYMTGKQWFDTFKQKIPAWSDGDKTAKTFEKIYLEAAKNASGIS